MCYFFHQAEDKYRQETITKLFDLSSSLNDKEKLVNANVFYAFVN